VTKEQQEAREALKKIVSPGDTVYCIARRVSRSGMTRHISLHVARGGRIRDISALAAKALGWAFNPDLFAVKVKGCGMDMGFHTVYSLSYALYFKEDEDGAKGGDPGYHLRHSWL